MKLPITLLMLCASFLYCSAQSDSPSINERVEKILDGKLLPAPSIDSVINVVSSSCMRSREDAAEGARIMKDVVIPYTGKQKDLSASKLGEVYALYGELTGKSGKENYQEANKIFDRALLEADKAKDNSLKGSIYYKKAYLEERSGETRKAFEFFNEAVANYRNGKRNADREITNCYNNQAMIYLRLSDLKGMKQMADNLRKHADACSDEWRDYALFYLYTVENVYFGTLYESETSAKRNSLRDSIDKTSLASIHLLETTDNTMLRNSVNTTWNYYNRAAFFLNFYERPSIDSIQYYVAKMTDKLGKKAGDFNFEVEISASSLLAEMWMKHGQYEKAKEAFTGLLSQIENNKDAKNLILDKIEIYKNLRNLSEETGHPADALMYADSIVYLTNLRHDKELSDAVKDSEIRYKTQETELALTQSEARRTNILMWFFAALGLILAIIVFFLIYAGRQRRQRIQKEMEFSKLRNDVGRQLTTQYIEGLENERKRMSAELHDGVCNDLLAIRMCLNNEDTIEKAATLIDNCRESVRRISHELMPPEFAYASIDEVLRYYVAKQAEAFAGRTDVIYRSSASGAKWGDVPDNVALEVYRIVQEATGNALKHSGANLIEVEISLSENEMRVSIIDNGKYINSGKRGVGIESIRRRARSINAIVEMTNSEEGGTAITLTVGGFIPTL